MADVIEDVSSLPGETVRDQDGRTLGEVKEIYAVGDDDTPMWVTVETTTGIGRTRLVFIPIARLKQEEDQIRTPYSFQHIQESPEVEASDELSEEDDRALRTYYSVGLADQEMVDEPQSYASQVPDEEEPAKKADTDTVEGQVREIDDKPPGERTREIDEAENEEKDDEDDRKGRKATAEDVLDEKDEESKDEGEDDSKGESKDESKGESKDESKGDSEDQDGSDEE
jgi:hypothetical protein